MNPSRVECYNRTEYSAVPTGQALVENSWSGHLTLQAQDDGQLWFYRVTFQGKIIESGTMVPGDNIGIFTGPVLGEPGQSFGMSASIHKPLSNESCDDSYTCNFPDWCAPPRSGPDTPPTPPRSGGGPGRSSGNYVPPP